MKASPKINQDTKWVFLKKGTCSRTLFYILNREFGNPREAEERAIDPLAGGIMQHGYQCGQLWGAAMAVSAEAFRRAEDPNKATDYAIVACKKIHDSFLKEAGSPDCEDIIEADLTQKYATPKLLVSGKFFRCFKLADNWAPKAIQAAKQALTADYSELQEDCISCASEVVKKLGGSNEQASMAAGLAGGIGLSGGGCGALAAGIWMKSYLHEKEHGKSSYPNPYAENTLKDFLEESDYEFECKNITGKKFSSAREHTQFIQNGGCKQLIDKLTKMEK